MIKKVSIVVFLSALTFNLSYAGDLAFPETQDEIVSALSIKDGAITHKGVEYVSKKGRVYKVVNNRRVRIRGLAGIVDSAIVPRAGAAINFELNSARIMPESYRILDEFGKALNGDLSRASLQVEGHTDSQGSNQHNMDLSQQRADAVVTYLSNKHGIPGRRLQVKSFGEDKPIASNSSDSGRAKNRRVEFARLY